MKKKRPNLQTEANLHRCVWTGAFFSKISSLFIAFISSLILIISSFGVICIPLMVVVFLLIYACFVPLPYRCQKKVSEINFDETLVNSQLLREIETVQWNMLDLSNAKEVRSFNLSNFLTNKFNSLRKIAYKERHKKCDKSARYSFYCSIVYVIQVFVSYCFAVVCFNRQIIDVGSFLIYTGALISISTCINNFIECLVSFEAELKYFNALVDIFNEYDIGKENIGNMPVGKFESLEFKDVSFSYGNDDKYAANISAGNLRYRYAKAVLMSRRNDAVLTAAPRYENSAVIMDMYRLADSCEKPVFKMSFDGDWDEAAWSRLRSFLYYLDK